MSRHASSIVTVICMIASTLAPAAADEAEATCDMVDKGLFTSPERHYPGAADLKCRFLTVDGGSRWWSVAETIPGDLKPPLPPSDQIPHLAEGDLARIMASPAFLRNLQQYVRIYNPSSGSARITGLAFRRREELDNWAPVIDPGNGPWPSEMTKILRSAGRNMKYVELFCVPMPSNRSDFTVSASVDYLGVPHDFSDGDWGLIRHCTNLTHLNLSGTDISGADMSAILSMSRLRVLDLSVTRIDVAGLRSVAEHPAIECLILAGCRLPDATFGTLQHMKSLRALVLDYAKADRQSLRSFISGDHNVKFVSMGGMTDVENAADTMSGVEIRTETPARWGDYRREQEVVGALSGWPESKIQAIELALAAGDITGAHMWLEFASADSYCRPSVRYAICKKIVDRRSISIPSGAVAAAVSAGRGLRLFSANVAKIQGPEGPIQPWLPRYQYKVWALRTGNLLRAASRDTEDR